MKIDTFHLKIKEKEISYKFSGVAFTSGLANEMAEEEAYVVKILHKVLNIQLPIHSEAVMDRDDFRALGKKLSAILFPDDNIRGVLSRKFERAQEDPNYKCRIIIEFDQSAAEIAALPWEYLFYEPRDEYGNLIGTGEFLAADSKKCFNLLRKFSFEFPQGPTNPPPEIELPLNVLLVTANPDGANHIRQIHQIAEDFGQLQAQKSEFIKVKQIRQCSFNDFQKILKDMMKGINGQELFIPDVIHFSGYGKLDRQGGKIAFVQEIEEDVYKEEWINDKDFADFFDELEQLPALVFLQISKGAKNDFQRNKGLALQLLNKKIPAVVVLQNPVQEWLAQAFVKTVYTKFLDGYDFGQAITEGRFQLARKLDILDHEGNRKENYSDKAFGSPILFINTEHPISLFQEKEEAPKEKPATTQPEKSAAHSPTERGGRSRSRETEYRQPDVGVNRAPSPASTPSVKPDEIHAAPIEVVEEASAHRAGSIQVRPELNERLEQLLNEIEEKLTRNKLEEAIEQLLQNLSRQSDERRQVLQQKGALHDVHEGETNLILSVEEVTDRRNKIRFALLKTLSTIKISDLK